MFQTRGYLPVPAPSLPAPDLLSSLCHRILPLEKAVRERVTHPLSHMSKPPIPSGLLHRVPALLHTSEMELSLPAPAWTWLPHCHSSSEFPSGFQPSPIPRSLNQASLSPTKDCSSFHSLRIRPAGSNQLSLSFTPFCQKFAKKAAKALSPIPLSLQFPVQNRYREEENEPKSLFSSCSPSLPIPPSETHGIRTSAAERI